MRSVSADKYTQRRFASLAMIQDTQVPTLNVTAPTTSPRLNSNLTIAGDVLDTLTGVGGLTARIDTQPATNVTFNSAGHFSITTGLALDQPVDGRHQVRLQATDRVGNTSFFDVFFTLDTTPPGIDSFDLSVGSRISSPIGPHFN